MFCVFGPTNFNKPLDNSLVQKVPNFHKAAQYVQQLVDVSNYSTEFYIYVSLFDPQMGSF